MSAIQINPNLTTEHDAVLTEYLRGESRLTQAQWQRLREAIDSLGQFYETFILWHGRR